MTADDFLAQFPEFAPTHAKYPTLIASTLAIVERYVSDSWDTERDEIVGLECAARIASGPMGRAAQLTAKDGSTSYSRELAKRYRVHACCYLRVV